MPVHDFFSHSHGSSRLKNLRNKFLPLFIILFLFFPEESFSQWVNNPAENTRVVFDLNDPINISSIGDQSGGVFIFWEDNATGTQKVVSFMHIDSNGDISFRADGKRISETTGDQDNPVSVSTGKNNSVVAWKDYTDNNTGNLLVQKVQANGNVLWNPKGIIINKFKKEISDYSLCADAQGEVFISYLAKEPELILNSRIMLQKIAPSGKFLFDSSGVTVSSSITGKLNPLVLPDDSAGVYIFWVESSGGKGVILSQHYDKTGTADWGKKPVPITDKTLNVITFTASKSDEDIYLAYQVLKKEKSIYHQLVSKNGKILWGKNGKICSTNKGSQSNPQMITSDASLILSWTNEVNNDRDIFIQKYNRNGKAEWQEGGVPVIKMKGDQFGQKLISDDHNGAIIAWIDRRSVSALGNIYSQRVTSEGKLYWDTAGVAIGSFFNTPKSYLSLLPDGRGSAIAVFKEKRKTENGIYVQKIFNTGTFVSQIIGFTTEVLSDSVKISWYSANETPKSLYDVERSVQTDSGNTDWTKLTSIYSDSGKAANFYTYYDKPDTSGTLYYRIVQTDDQGNSQSSEVSRVTYLESAAYMIVTQNNPNPFSDSTIIKFYLPEEANVKIEFFDNHIEKIYEINNRFPPGENDITFSAAGRQPGIYFYKFESGDFVEVKKMVLTN